MAAGPAPAPPSSSGPAFPKLGVRLEVLEQLAREGASTTNQLCHEIVRQRTVPAGWEDVPRVSDPARGFYAHAYRQRGADRTQDAAPPGTRALTGVLLADPATAALVGDATHFVSPAPDSWVPHAASPCPNLSAAILSC